MYLNNFVNLISATVPDWVSASFPIVRMVLIALIAVLSLVLIFTILFQSGNDGSNLGAMAGQQTSDTYFAKNKSQTTDNMLKRLTVIVSIAILVLAVLFFVSVAIYSGL